MGNHSKPPKQTNSDLAKRWMGPALIFTVFFMVLSLYNSQDALGVQTVPYSEIKQRIRSGDVKEVVLAEHSLDALLVSDIADDKNKLHAIIPSQGDPELLPLLEEYNISVIAVEPSDGSILTYLLPWVLILGFYYWMTRRMSGGGVGGMPGGLKDLLGGRFTKPAKQSRKVTFDDVAGQDAAKREVSELVDFLRDPDRFLGLGAEVPHGVLLMGPPGTGKTLLARALAGEADVPFFSTSGSEFIEVFVGVGAGRVRKMFEAARKAAPSIIFIDELDSIGRTRGTGLGGGARRAGTNLEPDIGRT